MRAAAAAVPAAEQGAAVAAPSLPLASGSPLSSQDEFNQHVREGHYEAPLMQEQVRQFVTGGGYGATPRRDAVRCPNTVYGRNSCAEQQPGQAARKWAAQQHPAMPQLALA